MKDPVALAYSGRVDEARGLALDQARSDDPFLVRQGLEALAVLGQQHGVRADAELDAVLVAAAQQDGATARAALQAAAALASRAVEDSVASGLSEGRAAWEILRYAGELPSHRLARALATGWRALPDTLRDEALLVSCVMPAADRLEAGEWGARALAAVRDASPEVRAAALQAVAAWRPDDGAAACSEALEDDDAAVRRAAVDALARLDAKLLGKRAKALGERCPEAAPFAAPRLRRSRR